MKKITLSSPAKINLTLDVIKKTASRYHEIRSIIMPIPLHDTITISKNASKKSPQKITLVTAGLPVPNQPENTILRAARFFFAAAKKNLAAKNFPHITIHFRKRIPVASGLGGGSSNAATTLLGLNTLFSAPLSKKRLLNLAKKIGMDVPFFLNPVLSLVTHFGEKCTPIQIKNKKLTRKNHANKNNNLPKIRLFFSKTNKISTAAAYAALDLTQCNKRKSDTQKLLRLLKTATKKQRCDTAKNIYRDASWTKLFHNDFAQLYPSKKHNTSDKHSSNYHLTGSGPCRFKMVF